jgi:hypothetical protein
MLKDDPDSRVLLRSMFFAGEISLICGWFWKEQVVQPPLLGVRGHTSPPAYADNTRA